MTTPQLLVIGLVWPEPNSSAAGSRMLQLITQFKHCGYSITFACAAKTSDNSYNLKAFGVAEKSIVLNHDSFDAFISELQPDIVLFDRFITEEQFGWRVTKHSPKALKILDTEDFHGLRKARSLALKQKESLTTDHLYNDTTKREIASIYRCDISLIISEEELKILKETFKIPEQLLIYVPFLLPKISEYAQKNMPTFKQRQHFITIGNFIHPPNYDGVLHLKQNIWPLIRKQLPKAELHIYGAYASQKVTQLHQPNSGFLIKGFTEHAATVMQNAKLLLAPLRFGAGLKGKLIEAMQQGTPCVMSTIAAEGMFGNLKPNGCIEDNPETFATKAVALYHNESQWNQYKSYGFKCINTRFNVSEFTTLKQRIMTLQANIALHRNTNFIGQMLTHHSMQSTKYLSKWIAEKNKIN